MNKGKGHGHQPPPGPPAFEADVSCVLHGTHVLVMTTQQKADDAKQAWDQIHAACTARPRYPRKRRP